MSTDKSDPKSVSKSVSLPDDMWELVDSHAEATDGDRSAMFRRLVIAELTSSGKWAGDKTAEFASAVAEFGGPIKVLELIQESQRGGLSHV
jgi:predicted transcriptional regulator